MKRTFLVINKQYSLQQFLPTHLPFQQELQICPKLYPMQAFSSEAKEFSFLNWFLFFKINNRLGMPFKIIHDQKRKLVIQTLK